MISTFLFSQNSRWAAEIFIYQEEEGTTEQLSFQATLASNVLWDEHFNLATDLEGNLVTTSGDGDDVGWDFVGIAPYTGYGKLGYGYYKIECTSDNKHFFLNIKSDNFIPMTNFDTYFNYSPTYNEFSWGTGTASPGQSIGNGAVLTIWELKPQLSQQTTSKFQPTRPTNLNIQVQNTHPHLTWNSSEPATSEYRVFRKSSQTSWFAIANNISQNSYTDNEVTYQLGGTIYKYKIRAVSGNGNKFSMYSPIKRFPGSDGIGKILFIDVPSEYFLYNAYPNPFNPTTTIRFSVETQLIASLRIYDIGGRLVETLVDGELPTGEHEIV